MRADAQAICLDRYGKCQIHATQFDANAPALQRSQLPARMCIQRQRTIEDGLEQTAERGEQGLGWRIGSVLIARILAFGSALRE